jgi:hypothetical protein
MLSPGIAQIK